MTEAPECTICDYLDGLVRERKPGGAEELLKHRQRFHTAPLLYRRRPSHQTRSKTALRRLQDVGEGIQHDDGKATGIDSQADTNQCPVDKGNVERGT
jgi:hypothetical protein